VTTEDLFHGIGRILSPLPPAPEEWVAEIQKGERMHLNLKLNVQCVSLFTYLLSTPPQREQHLAPPELELLLPWAQRSSLVQHRQSR
jgi:hypothetical protein